MSSTISLKLKNQEEKLVNALRREGRSSSQILREALWMYIQEKSTKKREKVFKEVNQVDLFSQEEIKNDERKVFKEVNQVDQDSHPSGESEVYLTSKKTAPFNAPFFDDYLDRLHHQVARVEQELDEWKLRYVTELQYWKETYASLQQEYHTQVKDTTRRIDEKFDRIMFYVEELRRIPPHTIEPSSVSHVDHQKEKRSSSLVRM